MAAVSAASVPLPDARLASALAADLAAAGFRSEALRERWGEEADDALGRGLRHPILRALGDDDGSLATLGRLFLLGMAEPALSVARALPRCGVAGLVALGLARDEGDAVTPLVLIRPQSFADQTGAGEFWIVSDLDEASLGGALPADHVLGVGGASRTLAEIVMPARVGRALDVGTGCGIQALLLSRHADVVVATDLSHRALAFGELNAQLNGVHAIEFRHGDMFDPVAGERFDLIVSNPPFVITPRSSGVPGYEYRDAGLVGDALVEQFVRVAPAHLEPGGVAQLLGNWETRGGVPGLDRVRSWVADGVDVWAIEREELSPLAYAELWIRDGGTLPRDEDFDPLLEAWLADFAAREVTAIGFGYLLLRRPGDRDVAHEPLRRFERMPQPLHDPGTALAAGLEASDLLAGELPAVLVTAADVTEARHFLPGSDDPSVIELRQGGGFGRTLSVDPALAALVGACDGELTVAQIVRALAELFEVPLAELWADLEPRIRALVLDGFLLVPPSPSRSH